MQPNGTNNPEELLSASFDGEFSGSPDVDESRQAELEENWTAIRKQLQGLPVIPVDLAPAVRAELESTTQKSSASQPVEPERRRWFIRMTAVCAVAAVALLAVVPMIQNSNPLNVGSPELASVAHSTEAAYQIRQNLSELIPRPRDCHVLVVNVAPHASVEETVSEILGTARDRGADVTAMHSAVDESAEYSAGFLLTAGSESDLIQESLANDSDLLEWNPDQIGGRSHEEIKEMFLASMKVPTRSDKVFGAMYVVDEESLEVALQELPADVVAPAASIALAAEEMDADTDVPAIKARTSRALPGTPQPAAPLIVIFRQQRPDPKTTTDQDQGALRPAIVPQPAV